MEDLFLGYAVGGNKIFKNSENFALVDKGGFVKKGCWYLCQEVNKVKDKRGSSVSFVKPLKQVEDKIADDFVALLKTNNFLPFLSDIKALDDERAFALLKLVESNSASGVTAPEMLAFIKKLKESLFKKHILEK